MEEDGGERGRETAATQSAADRKIKERDAVGSRYRFVRRERENERTRRADGGKISEVTRASRVSSFVEIANFPLPYRITLLLLSGVKGRSDDRLTYLAEDIDTTRNGGNDHRYKAELSITKREEKLMEHPF